MRDARDVGMKLMQVVHQLAFTAERGGREGGREERTKKYHAEAYLFSRGEDRRRRRRSRSRAFRARACEHASIDAHDAES